MADPETIPTSCEAYEPELGLLANGSSGPWEFSVDETISGNERWFAQIEGPSVYISLEIPSPDIVSEAVRFLAPPHDKERELIASAGGNGWLSISKSPGIPVFLVRDDEYEDRCFIVVGLDDSLVVRYSLAGDDLENLVEAMRQADQDVSGGRNHNGAVQTDASPRPLPPSCLGPDGKLPRLNDEERRQHLESVRRRLAEIEDMTDDDPPGAFEEFNADLTKVVLID